MKTIRRVVKNTIYLFLNWFIITFLSFLFWVIGGKFLLPETYGKATTAYQLIFFFSSLSNLGIGFAIGKAVPELIAKKEIKKLPSLVKFSLKTVTFGFLFFSLILFLFFYFSNRMEFSIIDIIFIFIGIFLFNVNSVFLRVWYGMQKMKKLVIANLSSNLGKILIAIFLLYFGLKHSSLIIALSLMHLFSLPILFKRDFLKDGTYFDSEKFMKNLALPAFFASIFWMIFNNSQNILLTLLKSFQETGYFSLTFMIATQISIIFSVIATSLFPIISGFSPRTKKQSISKLISYGIKYGLLIAIPFSFFLIIFSKPIILIFFRKEFLPSTKIFPLLLLSFIFYGISNLILINLYASGKTKLYRNISILVTTTYFITAIPLSISYGFFGMALSHLISTFINFLVSFYFSRRFFNVKIEGTKILKILIASIILAIVWKVIDVLNVSIFVKLFLVLFTSFLYFLILSLLKFFDKTDKKILETLFNIFGLKFPFVKKLIDLIM